MGICNSKSKSESRGPTASEADKANLMKKLGGGVGGLQKQATLKVANAKNNRGRRAGIRKDMHINIWYDESDDMASINKLEKLGI